jgi:hypothetical protein
MGTLRVSSGIAKHHGLNKLCRLGPWDETQRPENVGFHASTQPTEIYKIAHKSERVQKGNKENSVTNNTVNKRSYSSYLVLMCRLN